MDHVDLVDRIIPAPTHTVVIETPTGGLVLVDTKRTPKPGDTILSNDAFMPFEKGVFVTGVAYCLINFI